MAEMTKTSDRVSLTGKIHTATSEGEIGSSRDSAGRPVKTSCGQRSSRVNPYYVALSQAVTCKKCLSD